MNKKSVITSTSIALLLLPAVGLAQPGLIGGNLTGLVGFIASVVLNVLWIGGVAFVVVMFMIAGFQYLSARGEQSKISQANNAVTYGLVGTVVIIVAWSILGIVRTQLGV